MNTKRARRHSTLFRMVSTFIFVLLLLTNVSNSYADDGGFLTNLIDQLNTFIFGNSTDTSTTSSDSSSSSESDTTITSTSIDPTPNPPPPPPPPEN